MEEEEGSIKGLNTVSKLFLSDFKESSKNLNKSFSDVWKQEHSLGPVRQHCHYFKTFFLVKESPDSFQLPSHHFNEMSLKSCSSPKSSSANKEPKCCSLETHLVHICFPQGDTSPKIYRTTNRNNMPLENSLTLQITGFSSSGCANLHEDLPSPHLSDWLCVYACFAYTNTNVVNIK